MEKLGLYVHIPFCSKKCDYCDFTSFCLGKTEQNRYLKALLSEIDLVKNDFKDKVFDTIFIGGGTPSVVYDGFIKELSKKIFSSFNVSKNYEFTIEVNPNSFNEQKCEEYINSGVNRISVGVQNLNEKVVNGVGRLQSKANVINTFKILNKSKLKNISADVMLGLPEESQTTITNTIKFLIEYKVKHISAYTLQLEEGTPLAKLVELGKKTIPDDDKVVKQYRAVNKLLTQAGYVRYEISNYAKPGYECKHNQKYWFNSGYLGLGASSHSYFGSERLWHTKNLNKYIADMQKSNLNYEKEVLTRQEKRTERIMLSLRTNKGLNLASFKKEFNEDLLISKQKEINLLQKRNMIDIKNGRLKINEKFFSVSNAIILELV